MKPCICCGEVKPLAEFHAHKRMRDGHLNKCKVCVCAYVRQWAKDNPKKTKEYRKEARRRNPYVRKTMTQEFVELNIKRCLGCGHILHRDEFSPRRSGGVESKCRPCRNAFVATDPREAVNRRIRRRLRHWMNGQGSRNTWRHLGYTPEQLVAHIERQFVKGMGWHNMDKWHIDHIVPLSSFEVSGPNDPVVKKAWALPNLRPIWAKQNIVKADKREFLL